MIVKVKLHSNLQTFESRDKFSVVNASEQSGWDPEKVTWKFNLDPTKEGSEKANVVQ